MIPQGRTLLNYVLTTCFAFTGWAVAQTPNLAVLASNQSKDDTAALTGDAGAHLRVGFRALRGVGGTPADASVAISHFSTACTEKGWSQACAWLGYALVTGGPTSRRTEGLALLQKAVAAQDPVGMTLLGHLYQKGAGVTKDLEMARTLFTASKTQFALAQTYLTLLNLESGQTSKSDYSRSLEDLTDAALWGDSRAMVLLAHFRAQGLGANKSEYWATQWLQRGLGLADPVALYQRGVYYREGFGGPKSYRMAAALFQRSADAGYAPAQAALGMCYAKGLGVQKNTSKAVQLLTVAASRNKYAARQLALLQKR